MIAQLSLKCTNIVTLHSITGLIFDSNIHFPYHTKSSTSRYRRYEMYFISEMVHVIILRYYSKRHMRGNVNLQWRAQQQITFWSKSQNVCCKWSWTQPSQMNWTFEISQVILCDHSLFQCNEISNAVIPYRSICHFLFYDCTFCVGFCSPLATGTVWLSESGCNVRNQCCNVTVFAHRVENSVFYIGITFWFHIKT